MVEYEKARKVHEEERSRAPSAGLQIKIDLSDAFRHILVHKDDWELLGSTWPIDVNGEHTTVYFIDAFLPFGLCSSPALLSQ